MEGQGLLGVPTFPYSCTPNSDPAAVSQFHVLVVPAVDQRDGKWRKLELDVQFACGGWGTSACYPAILVKSQQNLQNVIKMLSERKSKEMLLLCLG